MTKSDDILPLPNEKSLMIGDQHFLYVFGGYGDPPRDFKNYPVQPNFDPDRTSDYHWPRGWIGNLNRFNLKSFTWEYLKTGR